MKLARPLQHLIESFEKLPGIGPKSAQRLSFYLLHVPQDELESFARALINLKKLTVECGICSNISESDPCTICSDERRNKSVICVVEQPIDILAMEKVGKFDGVYHVLHGRIDPLNNIRPEDIRIKELIDRLTDNRQPVSTRARSSTRGGPITEIILALNPDMEGEASCMYITKSIKYQALRVGGQVSSIKTGKIKITRLAYGLPSGASIEYADAVTLGRALEGRREY